MGFTTVKNCHSRESRETDFHRGTGYIRKVRHLDAFGCQLYLMLPAIRLSCKECMASFVWNYPFVAPKKRYTKAFEDTLPKQAIGATITHTARVTETPASTMEWIEYGS